MEPQKQIMTVPDIQKENDMNAKQFGNQNSSGKTSPLGRLGVVR